MHDCKDFVANNTEYVKQKGEQLHRILTTFVYVFVDQLPDDLDPCLLSSIICTGLSNLIASEIGTIIKDDQYKFALETIDFIAETAKKAYLFNVDSAINDAKI